MAKMTKLERELKSRDERNKVWENVDHFRLRMLEELDPWAREDLHHMIADRLERATRDLERRMGRNRRSRSELSRAHRAACCPIVVHGMAPWQLQSQRSHARSETRVNDARATRTAGGNS